MDNKIGWPEDSKFVTNCIEVVEGTYKDFEILHAYHYELSVPLTCTKVFKVRAKKPHTKSFPDPLAVLTFSVPLPAIEARTKATGGYFMQPATKADQMRLVNKKILYMSRLIVLDGFRKIGMATFLVHESLKRLDIPIVESLSPKDFTNKIFKREGFKLYELPWKHWVVQMKNIIYSLGLYADERTPPLLLHNRLLNLKGNQKKEVEHQIKQFLHHFRCCTCLEPSLERAKFILSKMQTPQIYMIWFNPRTKIRAEIRPINEGTPTKW